jgi:NADH-quinone oxidoreductase subunit N
VAGFWGKFVIFASALSINAPGLRLWFVTLAILGVLNAAVGAAYYLRIVGVMYFRAPLAVLKPRGGLGASLTCVVCAVLVILVGIYPGPLMRGADRAGANVATDMPVRAAARIEDPAER